MTASCGSSATSHFKTTEIQDVQMHFSAKTGWVSKLGMETQPVFCRGINLLTPITLMLVVIQCFILFLQHIVLSAIYGKILGFVLFTHFFSTFLGGPKKCPPVIIASRCAICSGEGGQLARE